MEEVKKYKYVGTQKQADEYGNQKPVVVGRVYKGSDTVGGCYAEHYADRYPEEWEEVGDLDLEIEKLTLLAKSLGKEITFEVKDRVRTEVSFVKTFSMTKNSGDCRLVFEVNTIMTEKQGDELAGVIEDYLNK